MYSEFDGIREDVSDALDYALDALERIDEVNLRLARLEKALALLIEGHPYGAASAMHIDLGGYE